MSRERRYDEGEVAEIIRRAAEATDVGDADPALPDDPTVTSSRPRGMTLSEIRDIGREVGIEPGRIDHAARDLERADADADRPAFLGVPKTVSRVLHIPRAPDEDEWLRIVVLLRETFGTRGETETMGGLRSWHDDSVQVHVEPWEDGHRVRMYAARGDLEAVLGGAISLLIFGLILAAPIVFKRGIDPALFLPVLFGAGGIGILATARRTVRRWISERERQLDSLADRIPRIVGEGEG